jgi:hypothetical protein
VIEAEDGNAYAIWATAKVLIRLMEKHNPQVGDVVAIRYVGLRDSRSSGRQYKHYCLEVRRQGGQVTVDVPRDTQAKDEADPLEITDADVPF